MPTLEKHGEESVKLVGKPDEEIHRWLDEFMGSQEYGYRHRKKRHHEGGPADDRAFR